MLSMSGPGCHAGTGSAQASPRPWRKGSGFRSGRPWAATGGTEPSGCDCMPMKLDYRAGAKFAAPCQHVVVQEEGVEDPVAVRKGSGPSAPCHSDPPEKEEAGP